MNAAGRIGKLLMIAAIVTMAGAGGALASAGWSWSGGILLGAFLGLTPFASWAWITSRGLESRRNKIIAALLVAAKLGVYSSALYLLVTAKHVSPVAVFGGMTAVIAIVVLGMLIGPAPRAGEAA